MTVTTLLTLCKEYSSIERTVEWSTIWFKVLKFGKSTIPTERKFRLDDDGGVPGETVGVEGRWLRPLTVLRCRTREIVDGMRVAIARMLNPAGRRSAISMRSSCERNRVLIWRTACRANTGTNPTGIPSCVWQLESRRPWRGKFQPTSPDCADRVLVDGLIEAVVVGVEPRIMRGRC